jgi:phosphomannomutase
MSAFGSRTHPRTLVLFDVDGTLSPARQHASQEMLDVLKELRKRVVIGFVGGSDLVKITEQLEVPGENGAPICCPNRFEI